jgi:ABC-type bacteriocin/lantibiotic exporter with double-glycine peptidase domain
MAALTFSPIRKLIDVLRFERGEIMSIYFYGILAGLLQLSLPLGIQSIISFVQAGTVSTSLVLLIMFVIIGVGLVGMLQVNVMKIIEKIQQQLFVRYAFTYADVLPRLNLRAVDNYYLPELTNRFFDTATLQKGIGKLLIDVPAATIQILFGLVLLSFYHPLFIFFGVTLVAVLLLMFYITGNSGMQTSIEESDYKYRVAGYLEELARVITTFKFSRSPALHLQKTDKYVTGYLSARTRHFRILRMQYSALIVFKLLITASMLIIGAWLLVNNLLTIGQFISSEIVILMVIASVEKLIVNLDNVYDVLTSVDKISKVTDKPQDAPGDVDLPETGGGLAVAVRNLSFGYKDAEPILEQISFNIEPGEKIALSGEFGTGKSTLLRILSGIYPDFTGSVQLSGIPVSNYNGVVMRSRIGIVLQQHPDIFEGTLYDNICLGQQGISPAQLAKLATLTGLLPVIEESKDGYRMQLKAAGEGLSGRMMRKILLMRALIHNPRLLLLEEPWLGLEAPYAQAIQEHILTGMRDTTAIIVTGERDFAERCNKIFTLKNGVLSIQ